MDIKNKTINTNSRFYPLIAMLFMTISICDILLVYRLVDISGFVITAGVFVMPIYYMLQDVVAEVYGFRTARQMIITMIVCMYVLSLIVIIGIHLPFPTSWQPHNEQYQFVLGHLLRTNVLGLLSVLLGAFANIIIISKWKALVHGRYFWMRSLGASAIGEILGTIVGSYALYAWVYPEREIFDLIWPVCIILVFQNIFYSFIGSLLVKVLYKFEPNVTVGVNINPFAKESK